MSLYSDFFYPSSLEDLFADKQVVSFLLEVEAQLAKAQAACGIFPMAYAQIIEECSQVELIDISQLKQDINKGGNAAIPLVLQLSKIVKSRDFEASKYIHLGATSQDIIDTTTILQIKQYIDWLNDKLAILESLLIETTQKYKTSVMIGRTLLQQAKPITFGLKTALCLAEIANTKQHLSEITKRLLRVQMVGAVGSGNSFINDAVTEQLAASLGLAKSESWQSNRGSLSEWAALLGVLSGNFGKIAHDISLLMQNEVAEVFEGAAAGKGGSSTMPHKRNPVTCAAIIANSTRVPHLVGIMLSTMVQEHERSAGKWHAEWETLTQIMELTAGSLEKIIDLFTHLEVDEKQMAINLELTNGLIYAENVALALSKKIGKIQAHEYVEKACKVAITDKKHLLEVLIEQKLDLPDMDNLFNANHSLGNTLSIIDDILGRFSHK